MVALGSYSILIVLFLFLVAVLWFLLPFAVFGTKDKLDILIRETQANTAAVKALHETMLNK
jgi:hypothetical protein